MSELTVKGGPDTKAAKAGVSGSAKTVNLTFSSPAELEAHTELAKAATADDRSIGQFIVRVLMGKESFEYGSVDGE